MNYVNEKKVTLGIRRRVN